MERIAKNGAKTSASLLNSFPNLKSTLASDLMAIRTHSNHMVAGFLITTNPEKALMSLDDIMKHKGRERKISPSEFVDRVFEEISKEETSVEANESLNIEIRKVLSEVSKTISNEFARTTSDILKVMNELVNVVNLPCKSFIDDYLRKAIPESAMRSRVEDLVMLFSRRDQNIKNSSMYIIIELLDDLEDLIANTLQSVKSFIEKQVDKSLENENEPQRIALEKRKEEKKAKKDVEANQAEVANYTGFASRVAPVPSMRVMDSVCRGIGGVCLRDESTHGFSLLASNGYFAKFEGFSHKVVHIGQVKVNSRHNFNGCFSCIGYSPKRTKFLVTSCDDCVIQVYDSGTMKQTDMWIHPESGRIMKARFLEEERVVGIYGDPAEIIEYQVGGASNPISVFPVSFAKTDYLYDMDLVPSSNFLVIGTGSTHILFKFDFESKTVLWKNSAHNGPIRMVQVSPNGFYVLSGSDDCKVIIFRESDGIKMAEYSDFTNSVCSGVWSKCGGFLVIGSLNEMVMLKKDGNKDEVRLRKISEKQRNRLDGSLISGLNVYWGKMQVSYVIIGMKSGYVYKVMIE